MNRNQRFLILHTRYLASCMQDRLSILVISSYDTYPRKIFTKHSTFINAQLTGEFIDNGKSYQPVISNKRKFLQVKYTKTAYFMIYYLLSLLKLLSTIIGNCLCKTSDNQCLDRFEYTKKSTHKLLTYQTVCLHFYELR